MDLVYVCGNKLLATDSTENQIQVEYRVAGTRETGSLTLREGPASEGLNVTAPSNQNLAPPGHYMMFILNGKGVPSSARVVRIK